ncbi:MAG: DNA replication/repair protein RecF [Tabrizicola sp.]|uniref:DNA replication/repair protein RecF n=1 Tax=Tabrizicola sp. TaxID=2005166 RepID=UPI00273512C1|nr:DNA replication/repair protein RecF [Tabrizicola sp.]MDP3262461.1 DNA replication/repair protein RecF [Tabrizicola sp.]MDP3648519.1 DNA replication/repair protein RecF [Paracoccaceae bacterium]MDZ4068391.1 DNA replication/repair protein RecF [Tabrizicola sp.]
MGGLSIKSLSLSHFRSHRLANLDFDGRPVALIGPNGAGKTNLLEAVSLFSPGRGLRRASSDDLAKRPESIGWRLRATVVGLGGGHDLETSADPGEARQVRVDGKVATQASLGRVIRILWLVPAMDRLWIEAAEGRRRFLDRLTFSLAPDHAELSLTYEKAMRDRNRLLKDQITDPHWYTALEAQMAEAGAQITQNRRAALARIDRATTGETAFPKATLALTESEDSDLLTALAEGRRRDLAAGRTLVGPHRTDLAAVYTAKGVPADQCSTGEQKALLISLILANARALAEDIGHAPVLLLDEVAAHLDEDRRAALYDEIVSLGAQALMTGTEAELFRGLRGKGRLIKISDIGGQSHLSPQEDI